MSGLTFFLLLIFRRVRVAPIGPDDLTLRSGPPREIRYKQRRPPPPPSLSLSPPNFLSVDSLSLALSPQRCYRRLSARTEPLLSTLRPDLYPISEPRVRDSAGNISTPSSSPIRLFCPSANDRADTERMCLASRVYFCCSPRRRLSPTSSILLCFLFFDRSLFARPMRGAAFISSSERNASTRSVLRWRSARAVASDFLSRVSRLKTRRHENGPPLEEGRACVRAYANARVGSSLKAVAKFSEPVA